MKWWPDEPSAGDMIRIHLGSIYHYGVFVSVDEVIQFGPPPVSLQRDNESIEVCVTDVDTFACGKIIEIAKPEAGEKRKRLPAGKVIAAARSRIGEKGYDLIHNNCEHFAYECVFGTKYSEQESSARSRWNERPILDVYLFNINDLPGQSMDILCDRLRTETERIAESGEKAARIAASSVLYYALKRSLGIQGGNVRLKKQINGKWICDGAYFSTAYAENMIGVAVSNAPVGLEMETDNSLQLLLTGKHADGHLRKLAEERNSSDATALRDEWLRQRSIYKASNALMFRIRKERGEREDLRLFTPDTDSTLRCCAAGKNIGAMRIRRYIDNDWKLLLLQQ